MKNRQMLVYERKKQQVHYKAIHTYKIVEEKTRGKKKKA